MTQPFDRTVPTTGDGILRRAFDPATNALRSVATGLEKETETVEEPDLLTQLVMETRGMRIGLELLLEKFGVDVDLLDEAANTERESSRA